MDNSPGGVCSLLLSRRMFLPAEYTYECHKPCHCSGSKYNTAQKINVLEEMLPTEVAFVKILTNINEILLIYWIVIVDFFRLSWYSFRLYCIKIIFCRPLFIWWTLLGVFPSPVVPPPNWVVSVSYTLMKVPTLSWRNTRIWWLKHVAATNKCFRKKRPWI